MKLYRYFLIYLFGSILSWFFFVSVFSTPEHTVISDEEIDQFVSLYGNDVNTSGIWQRVRDLASDENALKNISCQVHNSVWPYYRGGAKIDKASLTEKTLSFPGTKYKNILGDLIAYSLVGVPEATYYLSKGLKPDCAILCYKFDNKDPKWDLRLQVCELTI